MLYKDALILIDAIKIHGYKPNDWELSFMMNIKLLTRDPREPLTYKQHKALEGIYAKATQGSRYQRREKG
jgi:hypothetical protein